MARSKNGWSVLKTAPTYNYTAPNGKKVGFADASSAYILGNMVDYLHENVEPLETAKSSYKGVYSWRSWGILGGLRISYHQCAVAFDYNGHRHPYRKTFKGSDYHTGFNSAQIHAIRDELHRLKTLAGRNVIRWGMDFYHTSTDPMHFELAPGMTPEVTRRVVHILKNSASTRWVPAWTGGVLKEGQKGWDIMTLQDLFLKFYPSYSDPIKNSGGADGKFGPATTKVVMEFQRRVGLTPDGVVGRNTIRELSNPSYGGWKPVFR